MRRFCIASAAFLMVYSVSAAWAQYGLYGSPELLPVAQQSYPAQPAAVYQSHQPGAQYRYPAPEGSVPGVQYTAWAPPTEPAAQPLPAVTDDSVVRAAPPPGNGLISQAPCAAPAGQGCGACATAITCCQDECRPWYAAAYALVLGRSDARRLWTSYQDGDETNQLTNSQFGLEWKWGGEVTVGRRFCCQCVPMAMEVTYWTTDAFAGTRSTTYPGGYVSTPLALNYLDFGAQNAEAWFNGAKEHRLWRQDELHDFEINLVREQLPWACDSRWDIGWSFGMRYFRFEDYLKFGTLAHDGTGWDDLENTAYLSDRISNNLIGVQVGFDAAWRATKNVRLFLAPSVGVYDNYMDSSFQAYTGDGVRAHGPYAYFPVHATANDVAFLMQVDAGLDWQFSRNWSARLGYRVVAASGLGMADDQFPQYICDTPEIEHVAHYSSLVLHGVFFGVTYNF
jgi:hypothetical protein